MMRPHPPRLRMKRRKTVSVTPAMGARTVAGEMVTLPILRTLGTRFWGRTWHSGAAGRSRAGVPAPHSSAPHELSQNFFTSLFYLPPSSESPRRWRGLKLIALVRRKWLFLGRFDFCVLAAEALDAAGGVHELLFTGEERVAIRANFYADVALVGRPGHKGVSTGTVHTHFAISGMNGCFHRGFYLDSNH